MNDNKLEVVRKFLNDTLPFWIVKDGKRISRNRYIELLIELIK